MSLLPRENINHVMTPIDSTSPTVVQQGQKPSHAYEIIRREKFHHIPILDGEKLVGIVSSTDFLRVMYRNIDIRASLVQLDIQFPTILDLMENAERRGEITMIMNTDTIHEAAETLMTGDFHSLPVINNQDKLIGIVTSTDLIDYLHEHSH